MIYLITTIHIIVCFFLIIVVLLQSGKSGDIAAAFGGMGSQTAFGPRGAATALSKATTWSTIIFMITSITLSIMASRGGSGSNSNAPVVSYVAQSSTMSYSFDLKKFIADAGTNGIQTSWYLTDVFAGFEIWDGNGTSGLGVSEFTANVQ